MNQTAVQIRIHTATLTGDLAIPEGAMGLVLFAHGSGSSRSSPRNRSVAEVICAAGIGTLLFDLLTPQEEEVDALTAEIRFNIELLAERLSAAAEWVRRQESLRDLPIGYFGASTGGAAALVAAATQPEGVAAVVSRGGRPDLAGPALPRVRAPTLLIVGGFDTPVIKLNRRAFDHLECEKQITIIPAASHLFEEPGTLDQVARLAADWFQQHMSPSMRARRASASITHHAR